MRAPKTVEYRFIKGKESAWYTWSETMMVVARSDKSIDARRLSTSLSSKTMRTVIFCLLFSVTVAFQSSLDSKFQSGREPWSFDSKFHRKREGLSPAVHSALRSTSDYSSNTDAGDISSSEETLGDENDLSKILTSRLPTSVDDQVRQATASLKQASKDGKHRHCVRLLLPVIGATELDDWPGGIPQMMEAAFPLVQSIMKGMGAVEFQQYCLDESDGVYAILGQAEDPKQDSCAVLLPTADSIPAIQDLEKQVGPTRDLIIVNPQVKRRSDFGGFFGSGDRTAAYVEDYVPSFSLTNLICEGENIRILRNYPAPWRVYVRDDKDGTVEWLQLDSKDVVESKPSGWEKIERNQRDGGQLFDYGQPSYQEIAEMLNSSPNWTPKNPAERAAAAFNFIKDSL